MESSPQAARGFSVTGGAPSRIDMPHLKRLVSYEFERYALELIVDRSRLTFAQELASKLQAEQERLLRIAPDPPPGKHWRATVESSPDLPNNSVRFRVKLSLEDF